MELAAAGLNEQPFRTHGKPLSTVSYAAQQVALNTLAKSCESRSGICLVQGPSLSGKSTLLRAFVATMSEDRAVAVVDGTGLNTTGLLEAMLRQFGYLFEHSSTGELLAMVRVFILQQASAHEPPLVIIENTHALNPSAMRQLDELARLNIRGVSAVRIILASDRALRPLLENNGLDALNQRVAADLHLRPMKAAEVQSYLYSKLSAAGSAVPEFVFPRAVCNELWRASGGWPGILDRVALLALAKAEALPVTSDSIERPTLPEGTWQPGTNVDDEPPPAPMLYVTESGKTLQEIAFEQPRLLIGRSEHNDIAIASRFISRHHVLLVRNGAATFLMDLNSTNGTYVNSRRVSNHLLVDNDIISMGNHRIKFCDPAATRRGSLDGAEFADTVIMKSLDDMRRLLEEENTAVLPAATENLPTSGL